MEVSHCFEVRVAPGAVVMMKIEREEEATRLEREDRLKRLKRSVPSH